MPIFEYECKECNIQQEFISPKSLEGSLLCPKCNGKMIKIISLSSFKLQGNGWAKDNYSKDSSSKEKTTTKTEGE